VVLNGLSHLHGIKDKSHFAVGLIRGLGGNLQESTLNEFAKSVLRMTGDSMPDSNTIYNLTYDSRGDCLRAYVNEEPNDSNNEPLSNPSQLPIIKTTQVLRGVDGIMPWFDNKYRKPFLLIGPDGCGKSLVLKQCFTQLRSTQVAIIHCSAQTNPSNILQKLAQTCIQISSISGKVYKPKECENLILFLKDINLPKPNVTIGRHKLPSRFTSIVRIFAISYPTDDQLKLIYSTYLRNILSPTMGKHPKWSSNSNVYQLATSMVNIYIQVLAKFSRDTYGHYLFTPRELTNWCLSLLRYNLAEIKNDSSVDSLLQIWAYEACRIFHDRLVDTDSRNTFLGILSSVLQEEWRSSGILSKLKGYCITKNIYIFNII